MRGAIYPDDHAFADGPVFDFVGSKEEALTAVKPYCATDAQRDFYAEKLFAIWTRFSSGANIDKGVKLGLGARLINGNDPSHVKIDGPCAIRGILRAELGARIHIQPYVYIGDNTIISAHKSVFVGEATLIAHGVQIFDNDSHPTHAEQREIQFRRMLGDKSRIADMDIGRESVNIGSRCWIGLSTLVLKGVTVGDNTVVAACSTVTKPMPAGVIVAGNPAQVVRELTPSELILSTHN